MNAEDGVGELLLTWVVTIVGNRIEADGPKAAQLDENEGQ